MKLTEIQASNLAEWLSDYAAYLGEIDTGDPTTEEWAKATLSEVQTFLTQLQEVCDCNQPTESYNAVDGLQHCADCYRAKA